MKFLNLAAAAAIGAVLSCPMAALARSICFQNPMGSESAADPCIVRSSHTLYLYSTGDAPGGAYFIYTSPDTDRMHWHYVGPIFSENNLPRWGRAHNNFWAPEVHLIQGRYVCYFSMRNWNRRFCIGTATASKPGGPFHPQAKPIASDPRFGLIDATWFHDPVTSKSYVIWKEDRNDLNPPQKTGIVMQEVTPDGLHAFGPRHRVLENDAAWEDFLIEGPSFIYHDGWYYIFFSGNAFSDDRYAVGVARSRKATGPYMKYAHNPILTTNDHFSGPGHQFLFQEVNGQWTMFYHARDKTNAKSPTLRTLMSDPVHWTNDQWPMLPTRHPSEKWCLNMNDKDTSATTP